MRLNIAPRGVLQIDEAKFIFPNFEGRKTDYNEDGKRNVCIRITDRALYEDEIDNILKMDRFAESFVDENGAKVVVLDGTEARTPAEVLMAYGWNVKIKPPRDESEDALIYLKVNVNFNDRGPAVFLISNGKSIRLDETNIRCLDKIDILYANVDIRPYDWSKGRNSGRAAYLNGAEVYQDIDRFTAKHERNDRFDDYEE